MKKHLPILLANLWYLAISTAIAEATNSSDWNHPLNKTIEKFK